MVQAILAGRKTQTRRVVKMQPGDGESYEDLGNGEFAYLSLGGMSGPYFCPYGKVGDVLWVKENFYAFGVWVRNGLTKTDKQKWKFVRDKDVEIRYEENKPDVIRKNSYRGVGWYKRSALFMEQDMTRIKLRITNVRVERLQDISGQDAISEGITMPAPGPASLLESWGVAKKLFHSLWQSINGEQSWNDNPYVWVIEFERIFKTK